LGEIEDRGRQLLGRQDDVSDGGRRSLGEHHGRRSRGRNRQG
jgi:hypothetical protein